MNKLRPISPRPSPVRTPAPSSTEPGSAGMPPLERLQLSSLPNPSKPSREPTLRLIRGRPDRIFCFDIENKPGTYGPGDYTHPKVTAIAGAYLDEPGVHTWCFNPRDRTGMRLQLDEFRELWDAATHVMGHNIKGHDMRILNGLCVILDEPILEPKPMIDTCLDPTKTRGFSRSLENWCARWGCPIEKVSMPEHVWEEAYDGRREAVDRMRHRVKTDVEMTVWLYGEQRRRGLL